MLKEELKFAAKITPTITVDSYAWSFTEGSGSPATGKQSTFQTTITSTKSLPDPSTKVKLVVTIGGKAFEHERTLKALTPKVTKISWKNDHTLKDSTTNMDIADPVWVKLLGQAVTRDEPGAYTKSGNATAELEIEASESLTRNTSVQIQGKKVAGNDENFYPSAVYFHHWRWSAGELQLTSSPLYASVNYYETLDVKWQYRVKGLDGDWGNWAEMNQSQHLLYTVLATPTSPERKPRTHILDYASRWAVNKKTESKVCSTILKNGFKAHYTWIGNCNVLSSDFIRLIASVGIAGQQHRWKSKYYYPYGSPHVGAMVQQRTKRFTPVGGSAGVIEWWWHQWAQAESQQRDPSAASSHAGSWGNYEDYLFTHYRECTDPNSTPYQTQWVTNQTGQASGCEVYPANCEYLSGPLASWLGPDR